MITGVRTALVKSKYRHSVRTSAVKHYSDFVVSKFNYSSTTNCPVVVSGNEEWHPEVHTISYANRRGTLYGNVWCAQHIDVNSISPRRETTIINLSDCKPMRTNRCISCELNKQGIISPIE